MYILLVLIQKGLAQKTGILHVTINKLYVQESIYVFGLS